MALSDALNTVLAIFAALVVIAFFLALLVASIPSLSYLLLHARPELRGLLFTHCRQSYDASGWLRKMSDPWAAWAASSAASLWSFHAGPEGIALFYSIPQ